MEAIPRVVHVTWKTRTLPDWGADCVATFGRRHADYELRIWSDEDVAALVAAADDAALAATYARLPCGAARADLARLLILRAHGGVYADLDVQCVRRLEPLLSAYDGRRAAVVGREASHGRVGNAVLLSCRGHALWGEALNELVARAARTTTWTSEAVCEITGPGLVTAAVARTTSDVDVLPVDAFYPLAWRPAWAYGLLERPPAAAWCAHLWRGSWWDGDQDAAARGWADHRAARLFGGDGDAAPEAGGFSGFRAGRSDPPRRAFRRGARAVFASVEDFAKAAEAAFQATRPRSSRTVSVITPTTSQRQKFHAALYASFAAQRYSDRELVVVDSGADPSPFFDWLCDARVTYVFVRCARGGPSIGAKRNFAAALAAGDVLAHFDDDDAYGPSYVGTMRRALRRRGALAAKLSSWFVVDASRAGAAPAVFYFDGARTGPRRAVLSFGFSLVYRRAALDLCGGFPDASWGEDAAFLRKLVAAAPEARALAFHRDVAGVCAHVLHPGNRSRETEVAACGAVDATWLATESDVAPLVGPYLAARGGAPRRSPRFLARGAT